MQLTAPVWTDPATCLRHTRPDRPVAFFSPAALRQRAERFRRGFPGLVSYAVKANPHPVVLGNLLASGIDTFDVASPDEMARVRAVAPEAVLHYNNPVRSRAEIRAAAGFGIASASIDSESELEKLAAGLPRAQRQDTEIAVRFKLDQRGAAYDFGEKFGAVPDLAVALLRRVAGIGFAPALCFHPGTQCHAPEAWAAYVSEAAAIARRAGIAPARLNVGGGFPSHRVAREAPAFEAIFEAIGNSRRTAFGHDAPPLVCEPGRAMVGDAFALATRVKALRGDDTLFLNDGIYGALAEHPVIGPTDRVEVFSPAGIPRHGRLRPRHCFGPTCDSIDRLPRPLLLPVSLREGDYVVFHGLGAYSTSLSTRFNGYGVERVECVERLTR